MSKDDFPPGLDTEGVLDQLFTYIDTWKFKLFDALTSGVGLGPKVRSVVYQWKFLTAAALKKVFCLLNID